MPAALAGSYKWKADEYIREHASDSLHVQDWPRKELERHRPQAAVPTISPTFAASRVHSAGQDSLDDMLDLAKAKGVDDGSGARQVEWPPPAGPMSPAQRVALARGRVPKGESWDWCRPQPRQQPNLKPPPPRDSYQMERSLSSPSTLTYEGRDEASRVLGAHVGSAAPIGQRRPSATRFEPLSAAQVPKTCNQMYGARAHEADRSGRFLPKSTCDVCQFVDEAAKSRTPYCAQIRF